MCFSGGPGWRPVTSGYTQHHFPLMKSPAKPRKAHPGTQRPVCYTLANNDTQATRLVMYQSNSSSGSTTYKERDFL